MIWQLLLTICSVFTSPFRAPVDPDQPYDVTRYGPQNWEEAIRASHALQGEDDDIRYPEDDEPSYAGINGTKFRWPGYPGGGKIPYVLDPSVQRDKSATFLENKKCVTAPSDKYLKCSLKVKRSALTAPGSYFSHGFMDSQSIRSLTRASVAFWRSTKP
ncbi:hypothetical protein AVEN_191555-1 [Araneus ventricosus]|uniref:Uncharacterized protein n=1 Tax=Araneus ventricosus TaxID=182803 RepID=A0A4Y2KTT8_ARAVE|nr:hypothetical protein AVEN_191555-1 [Araneus ventricosus]